jgi:excisionase family DNA binding protein
MDKLKATEVQPEFVTLKELAGQIGTVYRTVHRAAQNKKIKTVRFGGLVKVPRREVERILAHGF